MKKIRFLLLASILLAGGIAGADAPKDALIRVFQTMMTHPYRMTMEYSSGPAAGGKTIVESLPTNRQRIISEMRGTKTELIRIGDKMFSNRGDKWMALPAVNIQGMTDDIQKKTLEQLQSGQVQVTQAGTDNVNGVPATIYQMTGLMSVNVMQIQINSKIWVRNADGLLLRQEGESGIAGQAPMKAIHTYEYPTDIKIEAPAL